MPLNFHSPQAMANDESIRCVVNEDGLLVFVSPSMGWALGSSADALVSKHVKSIIDVVSSLDSKYKNLDLNDIDSGLYEVALLRHHRDPVIMQSRIDIIEAPDSKKYKVIWLDPDNLMNMQKSNHIKNSARNLTLFAVEKDARMEIKDDIDVSDEEGIELSNNELNNFLELSNDLLAVYSRDGKFVLSNPVFNMLFGYSESELKYLSFEDLIFPEDRDGVHQSIESAKTARGIYKDKADFESRVYCKKGNIRYIEWSYKITNDRAYIVGNDITDSKRHEEELSHRESLLAEAQKIGLMGHWKWDISKREMDWSDQIYNIFGLEKKNFIPTVKSISSRVFVSDRRKIYKEFQSVLNTNKKYKVQFKIDLPDGKAKYINCEGRCEINHETKQVESLFGIMQDITERTLHERALCEAKDAAESAFASKTRFLANMSHELRTPLNAIIGFSEMMQMQLLGPLGSKRYLDYVCGIRESGEHLLDLISDILDMSKIEIGKYDINVEELNLTKLIRLAVHMVEGRAHSSNVRIVSDEVPEDVKIIADRRAVMQILLNLMSNALKFTNSGGLVEIRCVEEFGSIELSVVDNGIGIPADKIDMVTMPFEQVGDELVRKHEGSGLGLAITKDLVELHDGKLSIVSKLGEGTSVFVLLPIQASVSSKTKPDELVPV